MPIIFGFDHVFIGKIPWGAVSLWNKWRVLISGPIDGSTCGQDSEQMAVVAKSPWCERRKSNLLLDLIR